MVLISHTNAFETVNMVTADESYRVRKGGPIKRAPLQRLHCCGNANLKQIVQKLRTYSEKTTAQYTNVVNLYI